MKKEIMTCPITLGDYNRIVSNMKVYENLNNEQKDWLDEFLENHNYNLKTCVLKIEESILWVIINTKNSVKQFEDIDDKGDSRWN